MTKKTTKTENKKFSKSELLEKIKELFAKYLDTTGAIIDEDMIIEDGTKTELKAADENLLGDLEELINANQDLEIDEVAEFIEERNDNPDVVEKVLNALDGQDIIDFTCKDGSHVFIKVDGLADKDKLNEFVRNNIYPYNCNPEQELFF